MNGDGKDSALGHFSAICDGLGLLHRCGTQSTNTAEDQREELLEGVLQVRVVEAEEDSRFCLSSRCSDRLGNNGALSTPVLLGRPSEKLHRPRRGPSKTSAVCLVGRP